MISRDQPIFWDLRKSRGFCLIWIPDFFSENPMRFKIPRIEFFGEISNENDIYWLKGILCRFGILIIRIQKKFLTLKIEQENYRQLYVKY